MPKRKRDSDSPVVDASAAPSAQQQRVQHKLQQGTVKLGHAFKVAKGFERQKLGRRRKNATAQREQKIVQRIDAEIDALKALDGGKCARSCLYKTLMKIKAVAASPKLPVEVTRPVTVATDTAPLNVNARLCNSNPVKDALPAILVEVQRALGIHVSKEDVAKKRRVRAKDYGEESFSKAETTREGGGMDIQDDGRNGLVSSGESDEDGDGGREGEIDLSDEDMGAFDDRLASSDEDGGSEDMDVDAIERQLEAEGIRKTTKAPSGQYNHAADLSLSESDSPSASASPEPRKAPAPRKSSFLPSLTLGGYISGSGSDIDDDEVDVAPKKNRRGQRARQQLWEKKFGSKAKHIQKQERSQGWDSKRGATDAGGFRGKDRAVDRNPKDAPRRANAPDRGFAKPADRPKVNHKDDSGPIHPSWEAAKKAKEKKAAPVAFQGKKITFD